MSVRGDRGAVPGVPGGLSSSLEPSAHAGGLDVLLLALAGVWPHAPLRPRLRLRRSGDGYVGDPVDGGCAVGPEGVRIRFEPGMHDADFALLELPALPGTYVAGDLRVEGHPVADLARRAIAADDWHMAMDAATVRYGSADAPPRLELDLRGLAMEGHGASPGLELLLRRESVSEQMERLGGRLDAIGADVGALQRTLGTAGRDLGLRLDSQAQTLGAMGARFEASDARRDARDDTSWRTLEASLRELDTAQAARAAEDARRIESLQAMAEQAATQLPMFGSHLDQLLQALAAQSHQLQHAAAAAAATEARLEAMEGQLERIRLGVENVFWRRWLRALRGRGNP